MIILFENGLEEEASIIKEVIEKVYSTRCQVKKGRASGLFRFNKRLNGYEIQIIRKLRNNIILTDKDIFPYKSTSKEDDWVFGFATKQKQFIISVARLKTNYDSSSKALKISKSKYKKRIELIVVHEFGHWLIKNQKHYKQFILKNPETGHETELGMHCLDNKCVMSEFVDVKDLDKHVKMNYNGFFCKKCRIA